MGIMEDSPPVHPAFGDDAVDSGAEEVLLCVCHSGVYAGRR